MDSNRRAVTCLASQRVASLRSLMLSCSFISFPSFPSFPTRTRPVSSASAVDSFNNPSPSRSRYVFSSVASTPSRVAAIACCSGSGGSGNSIVLIRSKANFGWPSIVTLIAIWDCPAEESRNATKKFGTVVHNRESQSWRRSPLDSLHRNEWAQFQQVRLSRQSRYTHP